MGKDTKADRKATKPSSSARAAEVLNKAAAGGGFGFGGFAGANPIAANVPGFGFGAAAAARMSAAAPGGAAPGDAGGAALGGGDGADVPLSSQVDGEVAQCIRHLAKRDPTTKTKALQNLRSLIPSRSAADLLTALPPWIYMYRRLIMDASRAVRSEAAAAHGAVLAALGKAAAPHLKAMMGPWWLAVHDPYAEAAGASRTAFTAAFTGAKRQLDVLLYCRTELMSYLRDQLAATPQQLGDPRKDSPEELDERHERVQAAALASLAELLPLLTAPPDAPDAAAAAADGGQGGASGGGGSSPGREDMLEAVREVLCKPGFWKATGGSKSAMVRRAAYGLARTAAQAAPGLLGGCAAEAAGVLLGALGDKEPGNHPAMWEAVLTYGKYCPDGWRHVNPRKAVLPRLLALLRHGCYGSALTSLRALLPLLTVLPRGVLGPAPDVLASVLDSVWAGMSDPACSGRPAKAASLSAYRECLAWGLLNSASLARPPPEGAAGAAAAAAPAPAPSGAGASAFSGAAAEGSAAGQEGDEVTAAYCRALLAATLTQHVLPAALRPGGGGEAELVTDLAQQLAAAAAAASAKAADGASAAAAAAPSAAVAMQCLTDALRQSLSDALAARVAAAVAAADDASSADGDGAAGLAELCDGVSALLSRLQRSVPASPTLAPQLASAASQGLMAAGSGPSNLPPAASQLLASLLRGFGAAAAAGMAPGLTPGLSPATSGALSVNTSVRVNAAASLAASSAAHGEREERGGSEADVGGSSAAGSLPATPGGASSATAWSAAGGSMSLDSLIRSYCSGPVEGPAVEATASLLVAFCHSHDDSSGLWDHVLASASAPTASGAGADGAARLQRTVLLLRHYTDSLDAPAAARGSAASTALSPAAAAAAVAAVTWASASLDALATQLAKDSRAPAGAAAGAGAAADGAAAALLSTALGGNARGAVLLQPVAADAVLQQLVGSCRAVFGRAGRSSAADPRVTPSVLAAAVRAVSVLHPLLGDARCGLWALLPERMCEAAAAVAELAWRAKLPASVRAHGSVSADGVGGGWKGPQSGRAGSDDDDAEEEAPGEEGRALHDVHSDSEDGEEEADEDEELEEEEDDDEGERVSAAPACDAAAGCWADGKPALAAAAAMLPAPRVRQLVLQLAALLAAAVPGSATSAPASAPGAPSLGARAWAAHAVQLLRAAPGGAPARQAALEVLLAAGMGWRAWSTQASGVPEASDPGPSGSAGPAAAAGGGEERLPGHLRPAASLEHLARLVEEAGPGLVLLPPGGCAGAAGGSGAGASAPASGRGAAAGAGASGSGAAAGRTWVLLELLCARFAAASHPHHEHGSDEDEDDEEEGSEVGDASTSGAAGAASRLPAGWHRVVRRVGDRLLAHVVYGVLDGEDEHGAGEAHEQADERQEGMDEQAAGRPGCGAVLRCLVDELAEGCRGGAAGASHPGLVEPLPPAQASFLDALAHVASTMQRAAHPASPDHHHLPLLEHQQRLCRFWLATTRPEDAAPAAAAAASAASAASGPGLPPPALLRLLPRVAGPIRACAAAAAAAGSPATAEAVLAAARLPELTASWIRHCLAAPPVLVEPSGPGVAALDLVVACCPVPGSGSAAGGTATHVAAAIALARAGGGALAEAERPLLMQLVRHQLVRHAGLAAAQRLAAQGPSGSGAASTSGGAAAGDDGALVWPQQTAAARAAATRLAHTALVHYWQGLGQPDWHALLSDLQAALADAIATLGACLDRLCAAARGAADTILGGSSAAGTATQGPVALQLLRKLSARGVLSRHPAGVKLLGQVEVALAACEFGAVAQEAVQMAAPLLELQAEVAAAAGGGSAPGAAAAAREYGSTVSTCCGQVLQLVLQLGGVECYCRAVGEDAETAVAAWMDEQEGFWSAATWCGARALQPGSVETHGGRAALEAVAAQEGALQAAGLDAVSALMSVALAPGRTPLQPVAYRMLLGDALLDRLSLAESVGGGDSGGTGGTTAADVELPEYDGDDVSYLLAGGVRPEMAHLLLPAAAGLPVGAGSSRDLQAHAAAQQRAAHDAACSRRAYLAAWGLLLAHATALDGGSRALAVLRGVLREAGHLVHGLLGVVVPELDLKAATAAAAAASQPDAAGRGAGGGGKKGSAGAGAGGSGGAGVACMDNWRLADILHEIGLPHARPAVRATCRTLYRAVLRSLPATARTWFSDLRDRGLAAAVEAYTAAAEGPALLAAEMASVQVMGRTAAADSDSKFTVRASPASREVVAVMEVEDGAVLELLVKLPACLPLKAPEVECRRKVGVNDMRLRKWLLSIATFLRHQNGSVADAIGLWKRNVDSEFAGVDACLICYSVISSVNAQLPRLVCRTCNVRFHPACLYKWFKSAGKSQCPHCQALW